MLTLNELQKQFVDTLNEPTAKFFDCIQSNKNLSSQQHFAIYASSIMGVLQKALKEIYSVCYKLVGEDFFIVMSNIFIAENISLSPDIGTYGHTFANFVEQFPPAKSLLYLSDVAKLEWAWHRIFHAEDNKTLDFKKLAKFYATHGEKILFILPPESSLLSSPFPIHRIWEINQDDYIGEETIVLENNINYFYLIWRNQLEMRIDILTHEEWQILSWMQQELNLGEIAEKITTHLPEANLTEILVKSVEQQWLSEFKISK